MRFRDKQGASGVTVEEVIRALQAAGWQTTTTADELHQLQRENAEGLVTIAGKLALSMPPGVQRILWRHAQVEEAD